VLETVKNNGVFGHKVKVTAGTLKVGTPLTVWSSIIRAALGDPRQPLGDASAA
jgi:hypothetical protein